MLKNVLAGLALSAALVLGAAAPANAEGYPLDEPGTGNLSETSAAPGALLTYGANTGLPNESGVVNATPDVEFQSVNSFSFTTNAEGYASFRFRLPDAAPGTVVTLSVSVANGAWTDTETITISGVPADSASDNITQEDEETLAFTGWNGTTLLLIGGAAVVLGGLLVTARVLRRRAVSVS